MCTILEQNPTLYEDAIIVTGRFALAISRSLVASRQP